MTNTGAGSGPGSGTRVAAGVIAYTLGKEPCTGTGITWASSELDEALTGSVRSILLDDSGSALIEEALMSLGATDFVAERVSERVKKGFKNWRVGEVIAEAYLKDWRGCNFPWPMSRDERRFGASLPGADLVGFAMEGGRYRLVFAEVKTSSDTRYPPGVVHGRSGLRQQIENLRNDVNLRDGLVQYMLLRSRNTDWACLFIQAVERYLSAKSDVRLYGVLVRDLPPDERDLRGIVLELASDCPEGMDIAFLGIYLPGGRINDLGKDVLARMKGGDAG